MASSERITEPRRLRIALVTPEPMPGRGGVPGMAATLAAGLARQGHEVDCWSTAELRPDAAWADVPGLTLRVVDAGFRWGEWYSRGRRTPMLASLSAMGARAGATPWLARRLLAAHREHPYDVLYRFSTLELVGFGRHLHELPPLVLHPEVHAAGERRWVRAEREMARRCHSVVPRATIGAVLAIRTRQQRRDIRRAALVIAPSRRFAELVAADYGVPLERFRVVPNPVDLHRFHPEPHPRAEADPVRVTYVGRAAVRKGIDQLVALSHRLDDLAGTVRLDIVASASLWSDYRPLLVDVNPRVAVVQPPMPNRDVPALMAASDLLVQPSKYEPFAITVAEALACGTPVVATAEVGAVEGVDPACATVVPADDLDALEGAVRARVADALAGRTGPSRLMARAEAERCFDPAAVCAAIADALASVAVTFERAPT